VGDENRSRNPERANIRDLKRTDNDPTRFYAPCPRCSSGRQRDHQKLRCLGVKIDDKGVQWGCNHCDWKGGEFYEPRKGNSGGRKNGSGSPFISAFVYKQADGTPYLKVCKTADKQFPPVRKNDNVPDP
jgi:hypothetical protein